jgi:CrcB protein
MILVLLAVAGGTGALARFVVDGMLSERIGRRFPWATMVINVSGSFALGLLTGLVLRHHISLATKLILGTGFCGGYTTFSTASFETVRLIEAKRTGAALMYSAGSIAATLFGAAIGLYVGSIAL